MFCFYFSDVLQDIDDLLYGKNVSSHTSADIDKKSNASYELMQCL